MSISISLSVVKEPEFIKNMNDQAEIKSSLGLFARILSGLEDPGYLIMKKEGTHELVSLAKFNVPEKDAAAINDFIEAYWDLVMTDNEFSKESENYVPKYQRALRDDISEHQDETFDIAVTIEMPRCRNEILFTGVVPISMDGSKLTCRYTGMTDITKNAINKEVV